MARTLNASYIQINQEQIASDRRIAQAVESDIGENQNWLIANTFNVMAGNSWPMDSTYPYIEPTSGTTWEPNLFYRWRVPKDVSDLIATYRVEESGGQPAGVRFSMASDTATYTTTDVIGATTALGFTTHTIGYDNTQTRDTLIVETNESAAGAVLNVHTMNIAPRVMGSISAGKTTDGLVPFDSTEVDGDEPLSTWLRHTQVQNCEALRKKRVDYICGFSDNWTPRRGASYHAYSTTSTSYVRMVDLEFYAAPWQDTIEWAATGFYSAGSGGTIRVATQYMEDVLGTDQTVTLATKGGTAAAIASNNVHDGTDLDCIPGQVNRLRVYLKAGASSTAYLMGLTAWFAQVA